MTEREAAGGTAEAAYARAVALLDGLSTTGLEAVVISPGSRSTPLALAAARGTALRVHVIADERSAAFFALGLARTTGRPTGLVATSGSAPAHWLPAAIEACEDGQPLLLISADRPSELLGCGANQATEQNSLFAAHARARFMLNAEASIEHAHDIGRRAAAACMWPRPGPVHINAAFREPLVAADPASCLAWSPRDAGVHAPERLTPDLTAIGTTAARLAGRRGAILAGRLAPGDPAAAAIVALARALDCAVLADPLSGLRAGQPADARILCAADAFLRDPAAPCPDWLIRVGQPPVSRFIEQWASRCPDTVLLAGNTDWADPLRAAKTVLLGEPSASLSALTAAVSRAELRAAAWDALDRREAAALEALRTLPTPPAEAKLVRAIAAAAPPETPVFIANSLVVRDFDSFLQRRAAPLPLYANRGVSGIDGNISTAAGVTAGCGRATIAVVGDLALFHDLNALSLCRDRPIVVIVVNNAGGAIFGQLPQAGLPEFDALWLTPPGIDIGRAAALFELPHVRLDAAADLETAILGALATGHGTIIEFVVQRAESHIGRLAWWNSQTCGSKAGRS